MPKQTTRTSEAKIIQDRSLYRNILPQYLRVLDSLQSSYPVEEDSAYGPLVNFQTNRVAPRHNWFEYKQGYGEQLVRRAIQEEKPSKKLYVLDPFAGVGTTNAVAQSLGYKSIGFDINPVASFIANTKTRYYSPNQLKVIRTLISKFKPNKPSKLIPISTLLDVSFKPAVFEKLMYIKGFYESVKDQVVAAFFKTAYLSILEDCSLRVKDGNGIKLVLKKQAPHDIFAYYQLKCLSMAADIEKSNYNIESETFNGSLLIDEYFRRIKGKNIGIVVFSPPYANCFDYCEVYKIELWMGGFVNSYSDFRKYRDMAVRSHVNARFDHNIENPNSAVNTIATLLSCFNVWNKNLPDMIRGYFDDMTKTLVRLNEIMVTGSACYIVVANSGYKGMLVPTDLLLASIGEKYGFKVRQLIFARKIRASSQQMDVLHGNYTRLMRESIIILEKL